MARTEEELRAAHEKAAAWRANQVRRSNPILPDPARDRGHVLAATNPPMPRERVDALLARIDRAYGVDASGGEDDRSEP